MESPQIFVYFSHREATLVGQKIQTHYVWQHHQSDFLMTSRMWFCSLCGFEKCGFAKWGSCQIFALSVYHAVAPTYSHCVLQQSIALNCFSRYVNINININIAILQYYQQQRWWIVRNCSVTNYYENLKCALYLTQLRDPPYFKFILNPVCTIFT